jgi:hypothetical protein
MSNMLHIIFLILFFTFRNLRVYHVESSIMFRQEVSLIGSSHIITLSIFKGLFCRSDISLREVEERAWVGSTLKHGLRSFVSYESLQFWKPVKSCR